MSVYDAYNAILQLFFGPPTLDYSRYYISRSELPHLTYFKVVFSSGLAGISHLIDLNFSHGFFTDSTTNRLLNHRWQPNNLLKAPGGGVNNKLPQAGFDLPDLFKCSFKMFVGSSVWTILLSLADYLLGDMLDDLWYWIGDLLDNSTPPTPPTLPNPLRLYNPQNGPADDSPNNPAERNSPFSSIPCLSYMFVGLLGYFYIGFECGHSSNF
jgi:hypothetical protein